MDEYKNSKWAHNIIELQKTMDPGVISIRSAILPGRITLPLSKL